MNRWERVTIESVVTRLESGRAGRTSPWQFAQRNLPPAAGLGRQIPAKTTPACGRCDRSSISCAR